MEEVLEGEAALNIFAGGPRGVTPPFHAQAAEHFSLALRVGAQHLFCKFVSLDDCSFATRTLKSVQLLPVESHPFSKHFVLFSRKAPHILTLFVSPLLTALRVGTDYLIFVLAEKHLHHLHDRLPSHPMSAPHRHHPLQQGEVVFDFAEVLSLGSLS